MDQVRTGAFLKELRKEKKLTQSQLAERFGVSDRTVSRWENGSNMPDLSVLIELADFYGADIREIISGERKSGKMDDKVRDTLEHVSEYSGEEKRKLKRKMVSVSLSAAVLLLFGGLLYETDGFGCIPKQPCDNMMGFAQGFALAILVLNALFMSGAMEKIRKRLKPAK